MMKRAKFLKLFGLGIVTVAVAPKLLAKDPKFREGQLTGIINVDSIPDGVTPEDFIKEWKQSGVVVYRDTSPVLYVGENKYRQFEEACWEYMEGNQSTSISDLKIKMFNGCRVVKHPLLDPDMCVKVNSHYPGSAEWFKNVAIPS